MESSKIPQLRMCFYWCYIPDLVDICVFCKYKLCLDVYVHVQYVYGCACMYMYVHVCSVHVHCVCVCMYMYVHCVYVCMYVHCMYMYVQYMYIVYMYVCEYIVGCMYMYVQYMYMQPTKWMYSHPKQSECIVTQMSRTMCNFCVLHNLVF